MSVLNSCDERMKCSNLSSKLPSADCNRALPPHLSPFVDNEAEGYVPDRAETIKRLQAAAKKHILPLSGMEDADLDSPDNFLA